MPSQKPENASTPPAPAADSPNPSEDLAFLQKTATELNEDAQQRLDSRIERQDANLQLYSFIQSAQRGNVVNLPISSVIAQGEEVFWVCIADPVVVHIPFDQTFDELPAELLNDQTPHIALRRTQFLQKSIGLDIPFVVERISAEPNGNYIAYGSRTKALHKIRRRYFGNNAINPVHNGDIVTATVINVGPSVLWVNFHGADVRITNRKLSHRYMSNLRMYYNVGDKVKLKIMSLSTSPDTSIPEIDISGLPVEWEKAQQNIQHLKQHGIYAATVCSIRYKKETQRLIITLWIDGINVPAYCSVVENSRYVFHSGDKVLVEFAGIAQSSGYPVVKIKRTL